MSAWNMLAKIIAEQIMDGEFALVPAQLQQVSWKTNEDIILLKLEYFQFVKLHREKNASFHSSILAKITMSAWSILATIGVELIVDGEFAQTLVHEHLSDK